MLLLKLQTNLLIAALLIFILGHEMHMGISRRDAASQTLKQVMTLDLVLLILEIMNNYLNGIEMLKYRRLHETVLIMILLLSSFMFIMVPRCVLAWLKKTTGIQKKMSRSVYIPIVFQILLAFATIQTNCLAYINDQNEYVRGALFVYILLEGAFYLLYTMRLLYKYRKQMRKSQFYITYSILLEICMAGSLQVYNQSVLTTWSTVGIICVCLYIFLIYYNWIHDPLTGVENRASYMNYLSRLENRKDVMLGIINIDLDDFKKINDFYGHQEGDMALIEFAKLLQNGIKLKKKVIRTGGDEFIVFIENAEEIKMEQAIEGLKMQIERYNQERKKPYLLKFSYGVAIYQKEQGNIEAFLERVDRKMYDQKQKKKNMRAVKQINV